MTIREQDIILDQSICSISDLDRSKNVDTSMDDMIFKRAAKGLIP